MWDNIINIKLSTNQIITKFESKTPSTNIPFHQGVFFFEDPHGRVCGTGTGGVATTRSRGT